MDEGEGLKRKTEEKWYTDKEREREQMGNKTGKDA